MRRYDAIMLRLIAFGSLPILPLFLGSCSDDAPDIPTAPTFQGAAPEAGPPDFSAALAAQRRHTPALMAQRGVVGTAVGLGPGGQARLKIFTADAAVPGLPTTLDGVPVAVEAIGRIMARSDPTTRQRPAPIGFSGGTRALPREPSGPAWSMGWDGCSS